MFNQCSIICLRIGIGVGGLNPLNPLLSFCVSLWLRDSLSLLWVWLPMNKISAVLRVSYSSLVRLPMAPPVSSPVRHSRRLYLVSFGRLVSREECVCSLRLHKAGDRQLGIKEPL